MARKAPPGDGDSLFLTGRVLIAMPSMGDPRFEKTVIFLCHHTPETAMGLVINRALGGIRFDSLLKQLKLSAAGRTPRDLTVHFGGPVQTSRGFVLHSDDYRNAGATLDVGGGIALTATMDVLKALAAGGGPRQAMFALGYAGWGPGQLESELQDNAWLVCDPDERLIFDADLEAKWPRALAKLGADPVTISHEAGRA